MPFVVQASCPRTSTLAQPPVAGEVVDWVWEERLELRGVSEKRDQSRVSALTLTLDFPD